MYWKPFPVGSILFVVVIQDLEKHSRKETYYWIVYSGFLGLHKSLYDAVFWICGYPANVAHFQGFQGFFPVSTPRIDWGIDWGIVKGLSQTVWHHAQP